jgi:uncharacterized protein (UPF0332 family)
LAISWKQLENSRLVRPHSTSKAEIQTHLAMARRFLSDSGAAGLSDDSRFLMAYLAVYQLATVVLFASGYEAHGDDHHKTTFSALPVGLGAQVTMHADYFERCRRKRNNIQYDQVNVATKSEADELVKKADEFQQIVTRWLAQAHPQLSSTSPP